MKKKIIIENLNGINAKKMTGGALALLKKIKLNKSKKHASQR